MEAEHKPKTDAVAAFLANQPLLLMNYPSSTGHFFPLNISMAVELSGSGPWYSPYPKGHGIMQNDGARRGLSAICL